MKEPHEQSVALFGTRFKFGIMEFPFVTTKQSFVTIRKKAIRNSTNITSRNSRAQELFSTIRNAN
jgi:hypothetical protein